MPKPYDLNLHKSYNVNNNDKNYKSFYLMVLYQEGH